MFMSYFVITDMPKVVMHMILLAHLKFKSDSKPSVDNCQRDQPVVFRVDWNFPRDVVRRLAISPWLWQATSTALAKLTVFILFNIILSITYITNWSKKKMHWPMYRNRNYGWTQFPAPLFFVIVKIVKMEEYAEWKSMERLEWKWKMQNAKQFAQYWQINVTF